MMHHSGRKCNALLILISDFRRELHYPQDRKLLILFIEIKGKIETMQATERHGSNCRMLQISVQTNLPGRFRPPSHSSLRRRSGRARRRCLLRLLRHLRLPSLLRLMRLLCLLRMLRLVTSQRRPAPTSTRPVCCRFVHRRRQKRRIAPHARAAGTTAPRDSGGTRGDGRGEERSLLNLFLRETVLLLPELVQVQAVRVGARRIPEIRRAVLGCPEVGAQLSTLQPVPADFPGDELSHG